METRFKEHKKSPSHVFEHCKSNKHNITIENTQILNKETNINKRKIKEALLIQQLKPKISQYLYTSIRPGMAKRVRRATRNPRVAGSRPRRAKHARPPSRGGVIM